MKFFCDVMLGKLTKNLRMVGIDTKYSRSIDVTQIIKQSIEDNRILLTRRRNMDTIPQALSYYMIHSDHPYEQLREVITQCNLTYDNFRLFSICLLCNKSLVEIDKSLVQGKVPEYIFNTVTEFSQCPNCRKIYWQGTHYSNMVRRLTRLLAEH